MPSLLVVGTGLIGTSLALAARRAGYDVQLADRDADRLALAVAVGAGRPLADRADPAGAAAGVEVAVAAVPPAAVAAVCADLLDRHPSATVTHVASVQREPERRLEATGVPLERFTGSHPVAGTERSGPHHASADLFRERPWVVCPTPTTGEAAVDAVSRLAVACGGIVRRLPSGEHDELFARLSHVPQLLASALAGSLVGMSRDQASLAGSGLRDTSRLADSDDALWTEILTANAPAVAAALADVLGPLEAIRARLAASDPSAAAELQALLRRGREGRGMLSGKHGQRPVRWATVTVVVPDEPGALARLFAAAAAAEVNVEDVRVDHSPGQPLGLVDLAVSPEAAARLAAAMSDAGWPVTDTAAPPE